MTVRNIATLFVVTVVVASSCSRSGVYHTTSQHAQSLPEGLYQDTSYVGLGLDGMLPSVDSYSHDPEADDIRRRLGVNTNIVFDFESLTTKPTWPGGNSGPTIGVGVDLGHTGKANIRKIFKGLVDAETLELMLTADGVRGQSALAWIRKHKLELSESAAHSAFMRTCKIYWSYAVWRFGDGINKLDPTVKGVLLSVVINYGPGSRELEALVEPLVQRDMPGLASAVSQMKTSTVDSSVCKALQRRRKLESTVILLATSGNTNRKLYVD